MSYTERNWTESVCNEPRCDASNVGRKCCTVPNLQPIDWALAEFTRPLYLHFLKLDKPVSVPKEHFGDISGRAAMIAGIKRRRSFGNGQISAFYL